MNIDTDLAFLLHVATASSDIAGLLGVFHGAGELRAILHVVAGILAHAVLGPTMGRVVSMAVAVIHAVWGGVGGDGRAAVTVAASIVVLGQSGQCRKQLRARHLGDHGPGEGTGLGFGFDGGEVHSE